MPNIVFTFDMASPCFRFKQFAVYHDRCAMKVGTDGVLLGAWTSVTQGKRVLDVGTGSGLIALMLAQRNILADITAIDVDTDAFEQARENVSASPFKDRIEVKNISFQDFVKQTSEKFDVIVCNPPFFVNSLLSPDKHRSRARHANLLSIEDLLSLGRKIISAKGIFSLIYPFERKHFLEKTISETAWIVRRQTYVLPKPNSFPKRLLVELSMDYSDSKVFHDYLVIEYQRHHYSEEFIRLVKDFYLYL